MNKKQIKQQIKYIEMQIKALQIHNDNDICNNLYNSLILEKAILNKELAQGKRINIVDKLKKIFMPQEKLICDYWRH